MLLSTQDRWYPCCCSFEGDCCRSCCCCSCVVASLPCPLGTVTRLPLDVFFVWHVNGEKKHISRNCSAFLAAATLWTCLNVALALSQHHQPLYEFGLWSVLEREFSRNHLMRLFIFPTDIITLDEMCSKFPDTVILKEGEKFFGH